MNVSGLWKSFDGKEILRDVTFSVRNDEIVCLMGPSGVGKTTLLRILMGLEKPDRGQRTDLPKRFSAVFQEETLCEPFSAFRNVRIACPKTVSDAEIFQALKRMGYQGDVSLEAGCRDLEKDGAAAIACLRPLR